MPPFLLSPFQREKLEYYYRFLVGSSDSTKVLDADSMDQFNERILAFTGWDKNSVEAKECREVHNTFFEILAERIKETEGRMDGVPESLWLSIWASMIQGVMGMHNLPIYIRLLPRVLFKVIDRKGQGFIKSEDLAVFYKEMVHLGDVQAEQTAVKAYEQMTDGGRYPLNAEGYEQLFANFLIGRTPYGPGRYIFGCFEHEVQPFQLIQPMPEPNDDEEMQPIRRPLNRRPSKQFVMFPSATTSS